MLQNTTEVKWTVWNTWNIHLQFDENLHMNVLRGLPLENTQIPLRFPNSSVRNKDATRVAKEDHSETDNSWKQKHEMMHMHRGMHPEPQSRSHNSATRTQMIKVDKTNGRSPKKAVHTEMTGNNIKTHYNESPMIKETKKWTSNNLIRRSGDQTGKNACSQDRRSEGPPSATALNTSFIRLSETRVSFDQEAAGPKNRHTAKAGKVDSAACNMATDAFNDDSAACNMATDWFNDDSAACNMATDWFNDDSAACNMATDWFNDDSAACNMATDWFNDDSAACNMATDSFNDVHHAHRSHVPWFAKNATRRAQEGYTDTDIACYNDRRIPLENDKRHVCYEPVDQFGKHSCMQKPVTAREKGLCSAVEKMRMVDDRSAGIKEKNTMEEQPCYIPSQKRLQWGHSESPLHAGRHSPRDSDNLVCPEYDEIRSLHALIASKPDSEFYPDLGKSRTLQIVEGAVVTLLFFMPPPTVKLQDKPAWETWRLGTFSKVDDLAVFAIRLAQTGFYWDMELENIVCFSCGLKKRRWDKWEKTAMTHLDLSPDCKHANFIDDRNVPICAQFPLEEIPSLEPDGSRNQPDEAGHGGESSAAKVTHSWQVSPGISDKTGLDTTHETADESTTTNNRYESLNVSTDAVTTTAERSLPAGIDTQSVLMTDSEGGSALSDNSSVTATAEKRGSNPHQGPITTTDNPSATSASTGDQPTSTTALASSSSSARTTQHHHQPSNPVPPVADLQGDEDRQGVLRQLSRDSKVDLRRAASPSNASVSVRFRSFIDWPASGLPSPRRMVLAGFYSLGVHDSVRCFYCGITLRQWKQDDDPWTTHVRFRFSCDYVRAIKGDDFVRQTLLQLAREHGRAAVSNGQQSSASERASQSLPADSTPRGDSSTPSSLPTATATATDGSPLDSGTAPFSLPSASSSTRDPPKAASADSKQHQSVGRSSDASTSEAGSENVEAQFGSESAANRDGSGEHLGTDGEGSSGPASAVVHDGGNADVTHQRWARAGEACAHSGVACQGGLGIGEVAQAQTTQFPSLHGTGFTASASQEREQGSAPATPTGASEGAASQPKARSGATSVSSQVRSNEGAAPFPTDCPSGAAVQHQICTGTTDYADGVRGTANHDRAKQGVQNQTEPTGSQGRESSDSAIPVRGAGSASANQSSTTAAEFSLRPQTAASSSSQSASLQSDDESATVPRHASRSAPPPIPGDNTEGRENVPPVVTTRSERPRLPRVSRLTNMDSEEGRAYLQELQETNQRLRQRRTCRICRENDVDTIFLPCAHLCVCATCASTIDRCCRCGARIRASAHVYLE